MKKAKVSRTDELNEKPPHYFMRSGWNSSLQDFVRTLPVIKSVNLKKNDIIIIIFLVRWQIFCFETVFNWINFRGFSQTDRQIYTFQKENRERSL